MRRYPCRKAAGPSALVNGAQGGIRYVRRHKKAARRLFRTVRRWRLSHLDAAVGQCPHASCQAVWTGPCPCPRRTSLSLCAVPQYVQGVRPCSVESRHDKALRASPVTPNTLHRRSTPGRAANVARELDPQKQALGPQQQHTPAATRLSQPQTSNAVKYRRLLA